MDKNWNWTKNENQGASRNLPAQAQSSRSVASPASYFGPLSQFYQDMDHVFSNALRSFGLPTIFGNSGLPSMFNPSIDIAETDREYTIDVEVPGMREEDIRIELTRDNQLRIYGEKRLENEHQERDFQRIERAYGSFSRILTLPEDADPEGIEARFHNGVLSIIVPRRESASSQTRRIEVNAGEGRNRERGGQQQQQRNQSARQENPRQDNAAQGPGSQPKRAA